MCSPACFSGFLPFCLLPPPDFSSLHEALTLVPLAAAGHPPQPPAGPYEGVGGAGSPLPQIRDWLAEVPAGGVRREIFLLTEGEQWGCSPRCHSEGS